MIEKSNSIGKFHAGSCPPVPTASTLKYEYYTVNASRASNAQPKNRDYAKSDQNTPKNTLFDTI
jgi:hypothetical protein